MSKFYALDFDGVICDSAVETSITAWKACQQLWQDMSGDISDVLIDQFRQVRPVLETGYEAILIVRLLYTGISAHSLVSNYESMTNKLIDEESLLPEQLKQLFGSTRDYWIKSDAEDWLKMNPLFEGISDKLAQIDTEHCYIITTKQERFVHQILAANNIVIPEHQVFGLDRNMNKRQVLALLQQRTDRTILFVEDRLPTLINVQKDPELEAVKLLFADWGYNTQEDKQQAEVLAIKRIGLSAFMAL